MKPISKATFDRTYDEAVLGRHFVEDLDYYKSSRSRFWKAFDAIQALDLPQGARVLDIGGGIMAVLLSRLLGVRAGVGDVNDRARADVEGLGLDFEIIDLFRDAEPQTDPFDLVVLQEVIEHIPQPPYLVLRRLAALLKPGGLLFLTTPNGHRFRNLLYMVAGREILGLYKYPEPGEALGHQHEYTKRQMENQAEMAEMAVVSSDYYEDGFTGASPMARIAWTLARPAGLVPHWRNGLMMVLRTG